MMYFSKLAVLAAAIFPLANAAQPAAGDIVPDQYIVLLKPGTSASDRQSHLDWLASLAPYGIERTFGGHYNFNAYSGSFSRAIVDRISADPRVALVEPDRVWTLETVEEPLQKRDINTQPNAPWGLGTVSHRQPGSTNYVYDSNAGEGTFAYVVDSGIRTSHVEFEGRAVNAFSVLPGVYLDLIGHGTHVAGTIGSRAYGVAKKATLVNVKVFIAPTSTTAMIMSGFDFAVNDIVSKNRTSVSAINMSLGGDYSEAFNTAVEEASKKGVISVVAAGNDAKDAQNVSPASAPSAITVGATDIKWNIATYSNFGKVLDIFAPGTNILSCWFRTDTDTNTISGTSMATPHTVGLALYAMSVHGIHGVEAVAKFLTGTATKNGVQGAIHDSPNLLGNNNISN